MNEQLRVTEIFHSLQGESRTVGWPTAFVRLTGCPQRCVYCDTEYAFSGGSRMSVGDILAAVRGFGVRFVTVTGGEPLAQKGCLDLLSRLADEGYEVSLETGGAMDVSAVDPRVVKVMDLKTPASGEEGRNRYENLAYLSAKDQIKFVIMDEGDYRWSTEQLQSRALDQCAEVLFSPAAGFQEPAQLAEWILRDRLPVRFQLQLHKILWGAERGR
ncbi:7-carboxy-7-deazaguanine synthase QueE [Methyloterricola oryzae]|uniref:7-carboxy-7-deazaguanine synthase QueE n=1 Tax=Methyloterricola oryzae TaxID=1495050 RepID=UPI0005EAE4FB|nr:7-carboxy-7-deazaguanine synthase QueE [Methyloterricola oryzae]